MSAPLIIPGIGSDKLFPSATMSALDAHVTTLIQANSPAASPLSPLQIGDGSATLPTRPTTSHPVQFFTSTQPPLNGTTAGGTTGMVAGLDVWLNPNPATGGGGGFVVVESPLGSGNYGNRPATTSRVEWDGVVPPAGGGSVAGGTPQMVVGDIYVQFVVG